MFFFQEGFTYRNFLMDALAIFVFVGMAERNLQQAQQAREGLRRVVGFSAADEIEKLERLKKAGSAAIRSLAMTVTNAVNATLYNNFAGRGYVPIAQCLGGDTDASRRNASRVCRLCQGQFGQDQLCLGWLWQRPECECRAFQNDGWG
jgi:hypothetical protein